MIKAIVPENFHLDKHVEKYPVHIYGFTENDFNKDHALFLLSQITSAPSRDQQLLDNIDWEKRFIPLHAKILQYYVHEYRSYLNYFIATFVLECDGYYITAVDQPDNAKSYGYRLTQEYDQADIVTVDYGKTWLKTLNKKEKRGYRKLATEYGHLIKLLQPHCLIQIDYKEALNWLTLRKKAQIEFPELRDKEYNRKKRRIVVKNPYDQFKYAKANILSIYQDNVYCKVDNNTHRLHSPFTTNKSELRNFLTYNGQTLISIDIKNCQPYLITALFNKEIYSERKGGLNLKSINEKLYLKFKGNLNLSKAFFEAFNNEDVILYKSLVSNIDGNPMDLYEYMLSKCSEYCIDYKTREEVKLGMFEILFTNNKFGSDPKKLFTGLFPTVDTLCRKIKLGEKANLSCLLQSIESHMVLKVITKKIAGKYPNAPLLTIHDSISTTEKYIGYTKMVMEEELTRLTSLPPKLKEEIWSPKAVNWDMYKIKQ